MTAMPQSGTNLGTAYCTCSQLPPPIKWFPCTVEFPIQGSPTRCLILVLATDHQMRIGCIGFPTVCIHNWWSIVNNTIGVGRYCSGNSTVLANTLHDVTFALSHCVCVVSGASILWRESHTRPVYYRTQRSTGRPDWIPHSALAFTFCRLNCWTGGTPCAPHKS